MKNAGLSAIAALIVICIAAAFGLTAALGAHPWWAGKIAVMGAPVGAVVMLAVVWAMGYSRVALVVFALTTAAGYATAHVGKTRFAASYAEDTFAGQLWFFGWIGTAAAACAFLSLVIFAALKRS